MAQRRALELWYLDIDRDIEDIVRGWAGRLGRGRRKRFERDVARARAKDSLRAFAKLTERVDGRPRIVSDPPLIVPIEQLAANDDPIHLEAAIHALVRYYRSTLAPDRRRLLERYRYVHAARKVVGCELSRPWEALRRGDDLLRGALRRSE